MSDSAELIEALELTMPAAQGRRAADLDCVVVRELVEDDLALVSTSIETPRQQITRVSAQHHRIAQLMAQGRNGLEVSILTGYSPAYLSNLKNDPAFAELLAGYAAQRGEIFVDAIDRLKTLGISAIEELQRRVDEEPDKWSKRELVELGELVFGKGGASAEGARGSAGPAPPIAINVKFVQASLGHDQSKMIEVIEA